MAAWTRLWVILKKSPSDRESYIDKSEEFAGRALETNDAPGSVMLSWRAYV
jgi:hypothetical protein